MRQRAAPLKARFHVLIILKRQKYPCCCVCGKAGRHDDVTRKAMAENTFCGKIFNLVETWSDRIRVVTAKLIA
jgi:hypothetical protein